MPYPSHFKALLESLDARRETRSNRKIARFSAEESRRLIEKFHPEHKPTSKKQIPFGPNAGEPGSKELVEVLCGASPFDPKNLDLANPDFDVDVLVIGGGGAGAAAAVSAHENGAKVLLTTKLRYGDSNTVMATGLACAMNRGDSPVLHFLDTIEGSHFTSIPDLVKALVNDGPKAFSWMASLGVNLPNFEPQGELPKPDPAANKGGHTVPRTITTFGGILGVEITRMLKEEILNRKIPLLEFHPVVELLLDESGACAGAVLQNVDTGHFKIVKAGRTILATGGLGRLHPGGFATTNHYGATGDGLVVAYRAGAKLIHQDSVQFHPTGVVYPDAINGWLLTENFRAMGAHLVNGKGDRFVDEMQTRDVVTAAIIAECEKGNGIVTPSGKKGVWLDIPGSGKGVDDFTRKRFLKFGLDIAKDPVLIYPTAHYQNGGILIDRDGQTNVPCLYAAGEVAGGIHGRNRLGGNSLLDTIVFGRRAGTHAAVSKPVAHKKLNANHARQTTAGDSVVITPIIYPKYRAADPRLAGIGEDDKRLGFE